MGEIIVILAIIALFVILLVLGYVKAPPDMVFIISGVRKKPRMIIGKASFKIPFFERVDKLSLRLMAVDVKTSSSVPTADYININMDANVNVKVSNDPERLQLAAQNFLNREETYISSVAREVLEGNMREIVGQMFLKDMVSNRQLFADTVKGNAVPDFEKMGLDIVSFNVQNFIDGNGVIEDLGVDNITQIKKSASIARAESERDVEIARARAAKDANDARVIAETEIVEKNTGLEIRKAALKLQADVEQARADSAYRIQEQEQRRSIEIATQEADIARAEKAIELNEKNVSVMEQALAAEVLKKADAEKYKQQKQAEAELFKAQKLAEAKRFAVEQEAMAQRAQAEADKYEKLQEAEGVRAAGEAEAAAKQAIALAEAEGIRAKALAEAEGIDKKAEAMKKMEEAAKLEMMLSVLPEIIKNAAEPLGNIDKIVMYGDGNTTKLVGDIVHSVSQVLEGVEQSTGLDLSSLMAGVLGEKAVRALTSAPGNESE